MTSPTESFSVSDSLARRLRYDELATRFEKAWKSGQEPRLEEFLDAASAQVDRQLLEELLVVELRARAHRGESLTQADYRARFREHAGLVKRVFIEQAVPESLGGFPIRGLLGSGGFGRVFLGFDERLQQPVAIKILTLAAAGDRKLLLHEAQMAARLKHPTIVRVHQVAEDEDGDLLLVMEHIEGESLKHRLQRGTLDPRDAVTLAISIADALQHAHEQQVIHRDLKPANVLLDKTGRARVVDFGLALPETLQRDEPQCIVGTPQYMAPEQAAGETHRLDGRTDVWALGVVLYEALTGVVPFNGRSRQEIIEAVRRLDPRPLRQREHSIPAELERIVLRCLEKRMDDRYLSAAALIEDLRWWLEEPRDLPRPTETRSGYAKPPQSEEKPAPIVPKGLRSFDATDAEFFCQLLPGPRDRDGVPRSVRQWQMRLQETDPMDAAAVSVLYGPSGSGKSSFIKAGVFPHLPQDVKVLFVDATPEDTEPQLARRLAREFPALEGIASLADSISLLRTDAHVRGSAKVVLVLDQFEQWLHAQTSFDRAPLAEALRQCDGAHVQALLLVRDDFWQLLARLMHRLEVPLAEGRNSGTIDLFDRAHAEKVLEEFGRAFGRVPRDTASPERASTRRFIENAISSLAENERIVPVRLALFAEMFKSRDWTLADLRAVGGATGVGVWFLDETFTARGAPPEFRAMEQHARQALAQLLPSAGSDLKGHRQSALALADAAGLATRPRDFARLIAILDHDLRLITPVDAGDDSEVDSNHESPWLGRWYQLTHDYLVPSVREWLNRRKQRTFRGRVELRLEERADAFAREGKKRQLPAPGDWLVGWFIAPRQPTAAMRNLKRAANKYYGLRLGAASMLLALVAMFGYESIGRVRAAGAANALLSSEPADLGRRLAQILPVRRWVIPRLRAVETDDKATPANQRRASWGLVALREPADAPERERRLLKQLLAAEGDEFLASRELVAIYGTQSRWTNELWDHAESTTSDRQPVRLRAALALCRLAPESDNPRLEKIASTTVDALLIDVVANPGIYTAWREALRERNGIFRPALERAFNDRERPIEVRYRAATLLADYASNEPAFLVAWSAEADGELLKPLLDGLRNHSVTEPLEAVLGEPTPQDGTEDEKDTAARRKCNAAVALLLASNPSDHWDLLKFTPDPRLQSYLIDRLATHPPSVDVLIGQLGRFAAPAGDRNAASIRQALLLVLGSLPPDRLPDRTKEIPRLLLDIYRNDPDSGVHSAAEWVLRRWGQAERLKELERELYRTEPADGFDWYITPSGLTMVVFRSPGAVVLGPIDEWNPESDEQTGEVTFDYSFAISAKEVTENDLKCFMPRPQTPVYNDELGPDHPAASLSWYKAAMFCRQLGTSEGLAESQQFYPPTLNSYQNGMTLPSDLHQRTGYRLPFESEWEVACRAGSVTPRPYGSDARLLDSYAWSTASSEGLLHRVGSLKPNRMGLFDVLGNVEEWCCDVYTEGPVLDPKMAAGQEVGKLTRMSIRGGAGTYSRSKLRSANRRHEGAENFSANRGFRVGTVISK